MERTACCHCGSLRATVSGEPTVVNVCHCKSRTDSCPPRWQVSPYASASPKACHRCSRQAPRWNVVILSQSKRPPGSQKQEGSTLPPCLSWHRDLQAPVYLAAAHTVLRVLLHTPAQQESVAFPAQALRTHLWGCRRGIPPCG